MRGCKIRAGKRRAIVFTLDALLAVPLLMTIIGMLITFAATFRENILAHEYIYIAARDTMARLAELKVGEYGAAKLGASTDEAVLSVAELIGKRIAEGKRDSAAAIFEQFFVYPYGYDLEFLNATIGKWNIIASRPKEGWRFEVPYYHMVAARTAPNITALGHCPETVACPIEVPKNRYSPGKLIGPIMLRLRVRA